MKKTSGAQINEINKSQRNYNQNIYWQQHENEPYKIYAAQSQNDNNAQMSISSYNEWIFLCSMNGCTKIYHINKLLSPQYIINQYNNYNYRYNIFVYIHISSLQDSHPFIWHNNYTIYYNNTPLN